MVVLFAVFLALQVFSANSKVIPNYLSQPCPRTTPDYSQCTARFLSKLGGHALKGIRVLNMPSFNPLYIPAYSTNRTINSIASIGGTIKDLKIFGFKNAELKNFKIDVNSLAGEMEIFIPYLQGSFEYEGSIKLLNPILLVHSGYARGNQTNVSIHIKFSLKTIEKLGIKYYSFDDYNVKARAEDVRVEVTSKNPEEQIIADFATNFINENSRQVADVFQPVVDDLIRTISRDLFERVLYTIPGDELIPE